jgi:NADH-quinone oxidoreductase subunit C
VQSALEGLEASISTARDGMVTVSVAPARVHDAVRRLKERAGFETNTLVTAVDHFPAEPRYELAWQFLSVSHNDRVRLHARVGGADPRIASIIDLFPGAAYSERECFDMFGIVFEGHAGLKRLLMPEEYDHFPLRKDFPHHGIEPDRLYREWDRKRRERPSNTAFPMEEGAH